MTHLDYSAFAAAIGALHNDLIIKQIPATEALGNLQWDIVRICGDANPKFDSGKFIIEVKKLMRTNEGR